MKEGIKNLIKQGFVLKSWNGKVAVFKKSELINNKILNNENSNQRNKN